MKFSTAMVLLLLAGAPQMPFAADHHPNHLTPQQQLGRRLFEQSCGVCHTRPTVLASLYGPELSKINMGGSEEVLRLIISNGTQRMPGFKYQFTPEQIGAIVAYIKTLPPGTQDSPTAPPTPRTPTAAQ